MTLHGIDGIPPTCYNQAVIGIETNMADNNTTFELAYCGLVCLQCGAFTRGRCKGCHSPKPMHSKSLVKKYAVEKSIVSCEECQDYANLRNCKRLDNLVSKLFGFIFRSNRIVNLARIREVGVEKFRVGFRK
jgi:hypothetical protein